VEWRVSISFGGGITVQSFWQPFDTGKPAAGCDSKPAVLCRRWASVFQDAYNLGWRAALLHPYGGYFHAVPRLASALALLAPLYLAPLVLNLIAFGLQTLPVNLLFSARSASWGRFPARAIMAGLYVALPNCGELTTNVINAQCSVSIPRLGRGILTPRQFPTDHDDAVPTREYQTDQSSPILLRLLLALSSKKQKPPHSRAGIDRSLHIRAVPELMRLYTVAISSFFREDNVGFLSHI
jgi:hypothetical protein